MKILFNIRGDTIGYSSLLFGVRCVGGLRWNIVVWRLSSFGCGLVAFFEKPLEYI